MAEETHDLTTPHGRLNYLWETLRYPSARKFSGKLFNNETFLQGILTGERLPAYDTLVTIRHGTNISLDWIMVGIGEPDLGKAIFYSGHEIEEETDRPRRGDDRKSQRPKPSGLKPDKDRRSK